MERANYIATKSSEDKQKMGNGVSQIAVKLSCEEELPNGMFIEIVLVRLGRGKVKIRAHVPSQGFTAQQIWDNLAPKAQTVSGGVVGSNNGLPLKASSVKIHSVEFRGAEVTPETTLKGKTGDYLFFYVK